MSTASYLDRFLEPVTDAFTAEMANAIVDLRADAQTEAEIDALREKANQGTLTAAEEAQYNEFIEAVDVISILQSKARRFLKRHSAQHGQHNSANCARTCRSAV